jgi:phage gpG-like protein
MAIGQFIAGAEKVKINMALAQKDIVARVAVAIEKTCVDVSNHAKANHARSSNPHGMGRFISQTGTLIRSITPELTSVTPTLITGVVYSNMEYAAFVELGTSRNRPYPYLWPALVANANRLRQRVEAALK